MVGIFDLGSNSFIALVVDGKDEIHEEVKVTSAFSYMKGNKFFSCETLRRDFLKMKSNAMKFTTNLYAFGTAVFREARNGEWCFNRIKGSTQGRILSAKEEARYSYLSVLWDDDIKIADPLVFDLGGGSLEIIREDKWISLPFGTKKVMNVTKDNFRKLVDEIEKKLPDFSGKPVGIGGTFVTIASYRHKRWDLKRVHGSLIDLSLVNEIFSLIIDMTPDEVDSLPFVPKGRGKTLKSGLVVVTSILEKFGPVLISRRGYRYAIAWEIDSD